MNGDISGNFHTIKVKHPLSGFKAGEMEAERYLQQVLLSNSLMTGLKYKLQVSDTLQDRAQVIGRKMCFNSKHISMISHSNLQWGLESKENMELCLWYTGLNERYGRSTMKYLPCSIVVLWEKGRDKTNKIVSSLTWKQDFEFFFYLWGSRSRRGLRRRVAKCKGKVTLPITLKVACTFP